MTKNVGLPSVVHVRRRRINVESAPLYILANLIDCGTLESGFKKHCCADNGRPSKPIRLTTGLVLRESVRANMGLEDRKKATGMATARTIA